mgnify:CR=1 FL=1
MDVPTRQQIGHELITCICSGFTLTVLLRTVFPDQTLQQLSLSDWIVAYGLVQLTQLILWQPLIKYGWSYGWSYGWGYGWSSVNSP